MIMFTGNVHLAGTMERVCVILGSQTGIRSVLDVIVDKIRDKPDSHHAPPELKVLVTCLMHCPQSVVYSYGLQEIAVV